MTYGRALTILRDMQTTVFPPRIILDAIQKILSMSTQNAVTKDMLLNALRWMMEYSASEGAP